MGPSAADQRATSFIEAYNATHRPMSLMDMHRQQQQQQQQQTAAAGSAGAGAGAGGAGPRRPFDREKDLQVSRPKNPAALIAQAAALDSRFSSGAYTSSFI